MTEKRFEVMDYFDSENKPIKAIRDTETTEIYSMDNELEANSTCGLLNTLYDENEQLKLHQKNTAKEFQTLLKFIRSKGLTLTEYEEFKGDVE